MYYNLYAIRFKPKITPKAASSKTAPETAEERSYRMSTAAAAEKEKNIADKQKEQLSEFSFQPEIDPISKELGRSPDLKELVENTRGAVAMHTRSRDLFVNLPRYIDTGKRALDELRRKTEEKIGEAYTFKPAINRYVVPAAGKS
jgi:hypothetical protein